MSPAENPDEAALRDLLSQLQRSIAAGDTASASRITRGLIPDIPQIAAVVRERPAYTAVVAKIDTYFRSRIPSTMDDAALARVFAVPPDRTEISVRSASTEDLLSATPASQQFTGGTLKSAKFLRPKVMFYTVDFVKPGERYGTSMELFFKHQDRWIFLGPIWRMGIEGN
jgi:hypothetical protein